jgi:hypothetical protein
MPTIVQIQAIREGDVTAIYGGDRDGRLWRGQPVARRQRGAYEIKWFPVVDVDEKMQRSA